MADLWEDYAAGRTREEELDEIRPMVTPQEAEQIGKVRHAEHTSLRDIGSAITGSAIGRPIMDYVVNPIATAMEAYDKTVGSSFRFMLAADPSLKGDIKGSDITGLKSEQFTKQMEADLFDGPWYKAPLAAASIVANRPKAAINFATEMAADPLNVALGAGAVAKSAKTGLTAAKDATTRTMASEQAVASEKAVRKADLQEAKERLTTTQVDPSTGASREVLPEPGVQNTLESVPRDRHFDLAQADPGLEYSGPQTVPTNMIDLSHPMDSPEGVASAMKYKDKFKKGEAVERLVLEQKPDGRYTPVSGNGRTSGASMAGVTELHADVFKPKMKPDMEVPKAQAPEVTLTKDTDIKQTILPGFGRSLRAKAATESPEKIYFMERESAATDIKALLEKNSIVESDVVYQGVRATNTKGQQGISQWFTNDINVAHDYGRREGDGGLIRVFRKSDFSDDVLDGQDRVKFFSQSAIGIRNEFHPQPIGEINIRSDATKLEGPAAHKIPDPEQQTMIFSKIMDVEEWHSRALRALNSATHGDKDMTARARVLLDQHLVTPWTIKAHARKEPAQKSGFKPQDFKEQDYIAASAAVEASFAEDFAKFAKEYGKNPSSDKLEQLMVKLTGAKEVTSALMADAAKHGAALRAEKTRQRPVVQAMEAMIRDLPEGTTPERMIEAFNTLSTPAQKSEFLRGLMGHVKGVKGNFLGVYLNSILSTSMGLSVFAGNFTAGAALFATRLAEKRMAAMFSTEVLPHEAGVQAYSFFKSYVDLASAGYKNRKGLPLTEAEGQVSEEFGKRTEKAIARWRGEDPIRNVSGPKLQASDSIYEWGVDAMTRLLNIPSFVIGSGDALLGFAIKQSAMESAAYKEAMLQAQAAVRSGKELSQHEFSKIVSDRRAELMRNPDAKVNVGGKMTPLKDIGESEADLINMMSDVRGKVGGAIQAATENSLGFRALVPFFRVMYNSSAEALYRMPVLSLVSPKNVADFAAGGERRAMAMARVGMGGMLAGAAVGLTSAGIFVSDGPASPEMRRVYRMDQANKPGIHVGDTYVPYEKLGSIGQLVRTVANMAYMLPRIDDDQAAEQWSIAIMGTLASAFTDVRVAKDLHDLVAAASMKDAKGFTKYLEELPAKMLPYSSFLRQVVQQTEEQIVATEGVLGNIQAMVPGQKHLTYYNEAGEVTEVPNWRSWSGLKKDFGWSDVPQTDPVKKKVYSQMEKDQVHITGPARTQAPHVQLPLDAFMELRRLYGNMKVSGKTVFEALSDVQDHAMYQKGTSGPYGSKQDLISSVTSTYKQAALAELLTQKNGDGSPKWAELNKEFERANRFKAGQP